MTKIGFGSGGGWGADQQERRAHPRIQVSSEVRVSGPRGVAHGMIRDLSKGGAGVFLAEPIGKLGDTVEMFLAFSGGIEIAVMAELSRIDETPQGLMHALRFTMVEPTMQKTLLDLMEYLLKCRGSSMRAHPRVSRRLPIRYGKTSEFKAMLQTLSLGGLSMVVNSPMVLYEEVEVSVPDLSGKELLIINGRVVFVHSMKQEDGSDRFRIGLQFKELKPEAKACLDTLLKQVLELKRR
jgi:hypothetical protein